MRLRRFGRFLGGKFLWGAFFGGVFLGAFFFVFLFLFPFAFCSWLSLLLGGVSSIDPAFHAGLHRPLCEMPSRFRFFSSYYRAILSPASSPPAFALLSTLVSSIDPAFHAGLRRLLCEMPSRFRTFFVFPCVCHFFVVILQRKMMTTIRMFNFTPPHTRMSHMGG